MVLLPEATRPGTHAVGALADYPLPGHLGPRLGLLDERQAAHPRQPSCGRGRRADAHGARVVAGARQRRPGGVGARRRPGARRLSAWRRARGRRRHGDVVAIFELFPR